MSDPRVSDVMSADLEALLRAGRQHFPDKAEALSTAAADLADVTATLNTESAKASDPTSMVDLLGVNDVLHQALRRCVLTMNDCATALVEVAKDFGDRDDQTRAEMAKLRSQLPGLTSGGPAPQAPEPPQLPPAADYGADGVVPR